MATTDPGYASASFGLARVAMQLGDREEAVVGAAEDPEVFERVRDGPDHALPGAVRASCRVSRPSCTDLIAASAILDGLALDNSVRLPLVRDLHQQALAMLLDGRVASDDSVQLMGAALDENGPAEPRSSVPSDPWPGSPRPTRSASPWSIGRTPTDPGR